MRKGLILNRCNLFETGFIVKSCYLYTNQNDACQIKLSAMLQGTYIEVKFGLSHDQRKS